MTATTVSTDQPTVVTAVPVTRRRLWTAGLVSGGVAAVATTVTVALARAAGEDVAVAGEQIPLVGFAQFVLVGALLGIAMAKVFAGRASRPRRAFVRTTVALTVLSIVPDAMIDATTGTKLVLALTHVIAAAVIVPTLAARLPEHA